MFPIFAKTYKKLEKLFKWSQFIYIGEVKRTFSHIISVFKAAVKILCVVYGILSKGSKNIY